MLSPLEKKLLSALKSVKQWNATDIRAYDDITPNLEMLNARRLFLNDAIKNAEEKK